MRENRKTIWYKTRLLFLKKKYVFKLVNRIKAETIQLYYSGLKIVVNIDQDEYTDKMGEEAGARVVLHPQERMPFPEDEGILAKPGLLTSVGVRKVL